MNVDPDMIANFKANELWHSNTCYICYFAEFAWFDNLLKRSKVTNQSVRLDLWTGVSFSHQWSEYKIKSRKRIAMNVGF